MRNTGLQFIIRKYRRARVLAVIFSARQHRHSTGPCTGAGLFLRTMALFGLHWSGMPHFTGCCPPPSVDTAPPVSPAAFNLFPPQPFPAHTTPTHATGTLGAAIRVCAHRGPRVWEPVMSTLQEYTLPRLLLHPHVFEVRVVPLRTPYSSPPSAAIFWDTDGTSCKHHNTM